MSEAKPHSATHAENYVADNGTNGTKEKKKVRNLRCENWLGFHRTFISMTLHTLDIFGLSALYALPTS